MDILLLLACACIMPSPTDGSSNAAWTDGTNRHGQEAMDGPTLAAYCESDCTILSGGCDNGNVCHMGCHGTQGHCVPCNSVYADYCGPFGSCDPYAGPNASATENSIRCACAHGFKGRLCNVRTYLTTGGHVRLFVGGVVSLCIAFAVGFMFFVKDLSTEDEKYEWYHSDPNGWFKRMALFGADGHALGFPISSNPINTIKILKVWLGIIITSLQLAAQAFQRHIPWTWGFVLPNILRYLVFDWPSVPFWVQMLIYIAFNVLACCFGCLGDEFMQIYAFVGECMVIPAIRLTGQMFLGCTYYDELPNTFNLSPELSCYISGMWWLYAVLFFCGGTFGMMGTVAQIYKHFFENPYPKIRSYAVLDMSIKVYTTLISVAYGLRHPNLALHINLVVFVIGFTFVVVCVPHAHGFFNRMAAYGYAFPIISNLGAIKALEIDDPMASESQDQLINSLIFASMVCLIVEIVCVGMACSSGSIIAKPLG